MNPGADESASAAGRAPAGEVAPGRSTDDAERRARAWLSRTVEPGEAATFALVRLVGAVDAVHLIRSRRAPPSVLAAAGVRWEDDLAGRDLDTADRHGIRLVVPSDAEWPEAALRPMELAVEGGVPGLAPPLALWVRGGRRLDAVVERAVAIVGSRAATPYGEHVAAELAYGLADQGWTIVSGGALGIDGAAHRAALAAAGTTVAVLAGGLDRAYPAAHAGLFERIAADGLLVGEWPPGCAPHRHRFLIRNRIVAGLAAGTVVVEASARSGATSTARRCRELGRPVMAVPGPVTSALSVGTHELLRAECGTAARLVGTVAHVLEEVGALGADLAPRPQAPSQVRDTLEEPARRVLDGVPARRGTTPERIARAAGVGVLDVLRILPALEMRDLVELTDSGWRLSRTGRSAR